MIQRHTLVAVALGILIGTGATTAQAQEGAQAPQAGQPRLMVREVHFDFGFTPQNVKISHEFWLINSGSDTLRLTDIKAP